MESAVRPRDESKTNIRTEEEICPQNALGGIETNEAIVLSANVPTKHKSIRNE